jgi:hypothetical protein
MGHPIMLLSRKRWVPKDCGKFKGIKIRATAKVPGKSWTLDGYVMGHVEKDLRLT